MNDSCTYKINPAREPFIKKELEEMGYTFLPTENAFWRARDREATLTLYHNGTFRVQSEDLHGTTILLMATGIIPFPESHHHYDTWIGTDDSGKADFFGPLVVAGVLVTKDTAYKLTNMGVRDSKRLSDHTIKSLSTNIKGLCPHSILAFMPLKYNDYHDRAGNINKILGVMHAWVIRDILKNNRCYNVISDQFGKEKYIKNALRKMSLNGLNLLQRFHAETDQAVAAASILARDEYMRHLESLSERFCITLSAGTSDKVIQIGREVISKHGSDKLREVGKLHFRTTDDVLNGI